MSVTVRNHGRVAIQAAGRVFPPRRVTTLDVQSGRMDELSANRHLEILDVTEEHACPAADCPRTFGSAKGLATHQRAAHGD